MLFQGLRFRLHLWMRLVGSLLLCLCNCQPATAQEPDYFPLAKGNYWIYRGETKYLLKNPNTGQNEPKSEVLIWKMEVVDTAARELLFAALIKGGPEDLAWYQPGKERGDYVIIRVGTATYYRFADKAALDAWEKIKDKTQPLSDLGESGELFLDAPLVEGKVFGGDIGSLARGRYCWVVEGWGAFNPKRFPAAGKLKDARNFSLIYRTNPDHVFIDFVPGLGIVGYEYGHHGTLSETSLSLIEFGTAKGVEKKSKR